MDRRLAESEFLAGSYTIADMACYPWVAQHDWSGLDLDPFPHLARWFATVGDRPAVQRGMNVPATVRRPDEVIAVAREMLVSHAPVSPEPVTGAPLPLTGSGAP